MSFAALKSKSTDLSKLVEIAGNGPGDRKSFKDDRFWIPTRDKAGNGYAVIRFLPGDAEAATPWIRYWEHAFKGPSGQWKKKHPALPKCLSGLFAISLIQDKRGVQKG